MIGRSHTALTPHPSLATTSTMDADSQRPKGREGAISALNEAIEDLSPAKTSNIPPTRAVFGSVTTLLTLIRVRFLLFCHSRSRLMLS